TTTAGSALLGGPRRHHARVRARRHVAGARAVTAALATLPGSAGTLTLLATALLTGLAALATLSGTTGALATLLTATGTRRGRTRGRRTGSHAERVVADARLLRSRLRTGLGTLRLRRNHGTAGLVLLRRLGLRRGGLRGRSLLGRLRGLGTGLRSRLRTGLGSRRLRGRLRALLRGPGRRLGRRRRRLLRTGRRGALRTATRRRRGLAAPGLLVLRGSVRVPEAPGDRCLHGGRRGLHELALLLELGEYFLARDTELFRELVHAGLACHCSPQLRPDRQS